MKTTRVLLVILLRVFGLSVRWQNSTNLSFREAENALERAFQYIDDGKVKFNRYALEPLEVTYDLGKPERLISVTFRITSTVKSNYAEYAYDVLCLQLDESGNLRAQSTGRREGAVPVKQWKIVPNQ
jgi:hypothetical protein